MYEREKRVLARHYLDVGMRRTEVARRVGIGRRTLYNWIADGLLEGRLGDQKGGHGPRRPRASKLDPFKGIIRTRLAEYPELSAVRLFAEVRAAGYPGGYDQVKRHVREVRPREPVEPPVRCETPPGHQGQVDFAEFRLPWGKRHALVVVLGYSRRMWLRFYERQTMGVVIHGLEESFVCFGGVPAEMLFDQMKAVVIADGRSSGERLVENPEFRGFSDHWGFRIRACRPYRAQTKAKAEAAVQNVERRIMAPLRNRKFFSLGELREAIRPLLAELNERPFKKIEGSRRSWFEDLDRPALKPLPAQRYEYAEWRRARVNIDYHIQVEHAFYSVPHQLGRREVDVRVAAHTVEIFHKHRRVAAHPRIHARGGCSTESSHMPASHRAHAGWTPSGLIAWGGRTGPHTAAFVEQLLDSRPHPEQGYRSCLGLKDLLRVYGGERLEAACRRALRIGTLTYGSVKSILATGLDRADDEQYELLLPGRHANIRGPEYYAPTPRNGKES